MQMKRLSLAFRIAGLLAAGACITLGITAFVTAEQRSAPQLAFSATALGLVSVIAVLIGNRLLEQDRRPPSR